MRKNCNFKRVPTRVELFVDGKPVLCNVDNFPVSSPAFYKQDGFPCNEIGLLDRFATQHFDKDTFDIIAARVQELQSSPDDGLSDAQKLRVLKPAFVQTASECAAFEEYVYNVLSEFKASKSEVVEDVESMSITGDSKVSDVSPSDT